MEITKTFYTAERGEWRKWLMYNYKTAEEIWLVFPKKASERPRLAYKDAVKEALCFGWIDSIQKTLDEESTAQRFTPRRPKSGFSQTNKERLRRLVAGGKVMPEFLNEVNEVLAEPFVFPADIKAALQANEQAWKHFQSYSEAYQRIRVAYVDWGRNRPGEFEKRLNNLIEKTAQNKQFGYGIEEFY
jgi:uncharacterized protein YdeI (YjbR/CyaY-like superfamily)